MKLYRYTSWIILVAVAIFGFYGLVAVLKLPFRNWEHWIVTFGGMLFTGVLFGVCVVLLAACLRYLWLYFYPAQIKTP